MNQPKTAHKMFTRTKRHAGAEEGDDADAHVVEAAENAVLPLAGQGTRLLRTGVAGTHPETPTCLRCRRNIHTNGSMGKV